MKFKLLVFFFTPLFCLGQADSSMIKYDNKYSLTEKKIYYILENYKTKLKSHGGINGWRLQIKFTLKQEEIRPFQSKFSRLYPDINTHITFDSPFYKLSVGNFRTKMEALKLKKKIYKDFKGCYPIQAIIQIDLLK